MFNGEGYWRRRAGRRRMLRGAAFGSGALAAGALVGCGSTKPKATSGTASSTGAASGNTAAGASAAKAPQQGGTYEPAGTPLVGGVFPDFHKIVTFWTDGVNLYQWIYNNINRYDLNGLAQADLANLPEITDSGTRLTFTFRDGITWQQRAPANGRAFTSEDAQKTLQRILDPATVDPYRSNFALIDSMEIPDKKTLALKLKEPDAALLLALGYNQFVLPMEQATGAAPFKTAADVCGTGPYTLETYDEVAGFTLKRRPDPYWKQGKAHLDGIHFTFVGFELTAPVNALRANRSDFGLLNPDAKTYADFQKDPRFFVRKIPWDFKGGLNLNIQKDPYKDPRVRQAIHLAIDRPLIIQNRYDGFGLMHGPMSPGLANWLLPESELITYPGYRKDKSADLAEAKKLMEAAGHPNGFPDTMIFVEQNKGQADLYVPMLEKIGIKLQQRSLGTALAALIVAQSKGDFTVAEGVYPGQMDPHTQIALYQQTGASRNFGGYSDPQLDKLLADARHEFDSNKRKAQYVDIQRYLLKGMATNYVWDVSEVQRFAGRTYVNMPQAIHLYSSGQQAEDLFISGKT